MPESGYNTIQLYYRNTTGGSPAELAQGELAINTFDESLWYADHDGDEYEVPLINLIGTTGVVQTQLDAKAPLASPNFTGDIEIENIKIDGNTISSTNTNGDITIDPHGTGNVLIGNFEFNADATVGTSQDNHVLTYDHSTTSWGPEAASGGGSANDSTITLAAGDGLQDGGSFTTNASGNSTITFNIDASDIADTGIEANGENLRLASQGTGISGGAGSTLSITPAQTAITSIINSSFTDIGTAADQEYIKFDTANEINTMINNTERLSVTASGANVTGTFSSSGAISGSNLSGTNTGDNTVCTSGAATTAATLLTTRAFQTDLASTSTANFNGSAANTHGVTGTLAVGNGGTGATSLSNLITLTTHTSGNYVATITGGDGITSSAATSGQGTTHSLSAADVLYSSAGLGNPNNLGTLGSAADDDVLIVYDISGTPAWKQIEKSDLVSGGGGGGVITATTNGASDRIATYNAATTLNGEANLSFDGTTLTNSAGGIVDSAGQVMSVLAMSMGWVLGGFGNTTFGSGVLSLDYQGAPSDERLKTEISTLEYGLNEIKAISPKWYKFDESAFTSSGLNLPVDTDSEYKDAYYDAQRFGLMAADVKAVMPKLVSKIEDDKDYETYDKDALIFVLINAVKELEARIATLEAA